MLTALIVLIQLCLGVAAIIVWPFVIRKLTTALWPILDGWLDWRCLPVGPQYEIELRPNSRLEFVVPQDFWFRGAPYLARYILYALLEGLTFGVFASVAWCVVSLLWSVFTLQLHFGLLVWIPSVLIIPTLLSCLGVPFEYARLQWEANRYVFVGQTAIAHICRVRIVNIAVFLPFIRLSRIVQSDTNTVDLKDIIIATRSEDIPGALPTASWIDAWDELLAGQTEGATQKLLKIVPWAAGFVRFMDNINANIYRHLKLENKRIAQLYFPSQQLQASDRLFGVDNGRILREIIASVVESGRDRINLLTAIERGGAESLVGKASEVFNSGSVRTAMQRNLKVRATLIAVSGKSFNPWQLPYGSLYWNLVTGEGTPLAATAAASGTIMVSADEETAAAQSEVPTNDTPGQTDTGAGRRPGI